MLLKRYGPETRGTVLRFASVWWQQTQTGRHQYNANYNPLHLQCIFHNTNLTRAILGEYSIVQQTNASILGCNENFDFWKGGQYTTPYITNQIYGLNKFFLILHHQKTFLVSIKLKNIFFLFWCRINKMFASKYLYN